jgi:hypothetical protein
VNNFDTFLQGKGIEFLLRVQVVFLLAVCAIGLTKRGKIAKIANTLLPSRQEQWFHLINLGLILILNLTLYDIYLWRSYRLIAPHLLVSMLLLVAFRRFWLVGLMIAASAVLTLSFVRNYKDLWVVQFRYSQQAIADFQTLTSPYLAYDVQSPNPWCNTMLLEILDSVHPTFYPEIMSVPAGIGISYFLQNMDQSFLPPKSRYLLLSAATYERFKGELHVTLLTPTAIGNLYLNQDTVCSS